jgi:hypothetical protein
MAGLGNNPVQGFCVFGPVLSCPTHGAISLAMEQIEIEMVWFL